MSFHEIFERSALETRNSQLDFGVDLDLRFFTFCNTAK